MILILAVGLITGLQTSTPQPLHGLVFRTSVEQVEWSEPPEAPIRLLRVWVRLRIENRGDATYIVPRTIVPPRGRVRSGDEEYEFGGTEIYGSLPSAQFGAVPDSAHFVLLARGEAFESLVPTGIQVSTTGVPKTVRPGVTATMQLFLEMRSGPIAEATLRDLSRRWRRLGNLATESVWSDAFSIEVPAGR